MKDLTTLLKEKLKNGAFERQYHRNETFFRLADEILLLRKQRGLTQKELAEKTGTTQAVVSRLENASVKASLESIVKLAEALDAVVEVRLVPLEEFHRETEELSEAIVERDQNALDGIYYFEAQRLFENSAGWIKGEQFSQMLSISHKPSLAPISKSVKVREPA